MISKLIQKDRQTLESLCKKMTPEERLVAFYNHSQSVAILNQAGRKARKKRPTKAVCGR